MAKRKMKDRYRAWHYNLVIELEYACTHLPAHTNTLLTAHALVQCPGPGSSQNNSGAAPPAAI